MRYLTWRLVWSEDGQHGVGPEDAMMAQGATVESSQWVDPDLLTGTVLGYLISGSISPTSLSEWDVAEISADDALAFAMTMNPSAVFDGEGRIIEPA